MAEKEKIAGTTEAWESEELGASTEHARPAPSDLVRQIEESLEMQAISIRLPKSLIESFKLLGTFHGIGYQPLMRDALSRFAQSEMKAIVSGLVNSQKKAEQADTPIPTKPAGARKKAA